MKKDIQNEKHPTKDVLMKYRKIIGSAAVVFAMVAVCGVSFLERANSKAVPTGTMMSVSEISKTNTEVKDTFKVSAISHEDMMDVSFQTTQLAQQELSDKYVDEAFASSDEKDQAAVDALTAANGYLEQPTTEATTEKQEKDPEPAQHVEDYVPANPVTYTDYTYADENGTYEYLGDYLLTAYCPCPICCGVYSNMENPKTASGTTPVAGRTVAGPAELAFGTQLNINGMIFTVEDRGGAINGKHLDIYFNTHEEALAFGLRTVPVFLVVQ